MQINIKHIIINSQFVSTMGDPYYGNIYYGANVDYTLIKDGLTLEGTYKLSGDEADDLRQLLDKLETKIKAQLSK